MKTPGTFGRFGGCYAPESLMPALEALEAEFLKLQEDAAFQQEFRYMLRHFAGRPTPMYHAKNLSQHFGGAQIWFKREDLLHGGAHKTNNAIGQALMARNMGKNRIIAETGAGQHGVATAMAGALMGMETIIYMGAVDVARQQPNVFRMELLGAKVVAVQSGGKTLKDAINEAMRDWITNVRTTHYIIGTVAGPHPFPQLVKYFHRCIGEEARLQMVEQAGKVPAAVLACVGGGSNAIGIFQGFMDDPKVRLIGVEPAGYGLETDKHGAVLAKGSFGVLQGMKSLLLQTEDGQILNTHSISAGLDYPSVGPEHAYLKEAGRAEYTAATDEEALEAFALCSRKEGILPALETSHALVEAFKLAPTLPESEHLLVSLSGRGDKDLQTIREAMGASVESSKG